MNKKDRDYLRRLLAFGGILAASFLAYLMISIHFSSVPGMLKWEHDLFGYKDRIAAGKPSPKIIIVGGSNALFGVSASQIESELGIPAVNYANDVWLSTYLLERGKAVAGKGDIMLIPLEYEFYWYQGKLMFEGQTSKERYILTYDSEYFNTLNPLEKVNVVSIGAIDTINNIRSRLNPIKPFYTVETINEWGDETNNSYSNRDTKRFKPIRVNFPDDFMRRFPDYDGCRAILRLSEWADENGITLIATYPSIVMYEDYALPKNKQKFEMISEFYARNGIATIGEPLDFAYGVEMFYDTNYHLNDWGMRMRTDFIIKHLREYAKNPSEGTAIGKR